ncbi:motile sperm domain-containing protein 2-like isoform X1 [Tigriopus californicus]|uniref:motile sperm domain-containing protein 2-like isoform X1 n=1 Tax=Tigriopus californicus TaxID=6832 RepID=UPI0027DA3AAB|nr:motile sperm domain-containing protein 2-like isoform X1 [Tigriopus californicus]
MIVNSLKWRKESGIGYLTPDDLSQSLKERGSLYSKNYDIDGKKLLVFDVKKHVKGKEIRDDIRKFFLYQVERIEREENGDLLTLVFDCSGCGLKNMDLDFIQYMIGVFKDYTPWNLNYILVYDMPWVLNAAWKVIKSWLPASAVKKIKFLNKQNIGEYVNSNQRFTAWGGSDPWEYEFISGAKA